MQGQKSRDIRKIVFALRTENDKLINWHVKYDDTFNPHRNHGGNMD